MPHPTSRRRWVPVLLAAVVGATGMLGAHLLPTSAAPGGPDDEAGRTACRAVGDGSLPDRRPQLRAPHAPLSTAERGYALHLARAAMPETARDVRGAPGGEVLAADLPTLADRTEHRLVTVAIYDYASDQLHPLLVDLTEETVVGDGPAPGLQLPPTADEAAAALDLARRAEPAPAFLEEYQQLTGDPLLTPEQVQVVVGVWRPAYPALAEDSALSVCGSHRCLQLLVALPSGHYLNTHDVAVDLSARTVVRIPQEHSHDSHQH